MLVLSSISNSPGLDLTVWSGAFYSCFSIEIYFDDYVLTARTVRCCQF